MKQFIRLGVVWFVLLRCLALSGGGCRGTTAGPEDQEPSFSFICKCCLIPMKVKSLDDPCTVCRCNHKASECK